MKQSDVERNERRLADLFNTAKRNNSNGRDLCNEEEEKRKRTWSKFNWPIRFDLPKHRSSTSATIREGNVGHVATTWKTAASSKTTVSTTWWSICAGDTRTVGSFFENLFVPKDKTPLRSVRNSIEDRYFYLTSFK